MTRRTGQGLCEVDAGTWVALLGLVEAAAAVVAPIEIAAGTSSGPTAAPPAAVAVVAAAAPAAWPPAAPAAPAAGAWATVVDAAGAAGTAVCALATVVAAIAVKRRASLMPKSPDWYCDDILF
jgi:hypothetical protein